jgi:hypothetical protein
MHCFKEFLKGSLKRAEGMVFSGSRRQFARRRGIGVHLLLLVGITRSVFLL